MSVIRFSRPFNIKTWPSTTKITLNFSQKPDNGNDENKTDPPKEKTTNESKDRLNELLAKMTTETNLKLVKSVITGKRPPPKEMKSREKETNIFAATKEVAEALGGDVNKTESELLSKLLNSSNVGGGKQNNNKSTDLSEIISNMKVDTTLSTQTKTYAKKRTEQKPYLSKMDSRARNTNWQELPSKKEFGQQIDFFGGKPLGIFTSAKELKEKPSTLKYWDEMRRQELHVAFSRAPKNHFQRMAQWTEEGKLWKFPIDNEQGLDEEAKVSFADHIFLEQHLESWCPSRGPLRHFMELVCVGLSKNPYYTVAQKVEHIEWYKNYFEEKKDVLSKVIIDDDSKNEKLN